MDKLTLLVDVRILSDKIKQLEGAIEKLIGKYSPMADFIDKEKIVKDLQKALKGE